MKRFLFISTALLVFVCSFAQQGNSDLLCLSFLNNRCLICSYLHLIFVYVYSICKCGVNIHKVLLTLYINNCIIQLY